MSFADTQQWINRRPTEAGFYWVRKNIQQRIVTVFTLEGKLFTNEDGGASIDDSMYDDVYWSYIQSPKFNPEA